MAQEKAYTVYFQSDRDGEAAIYRVDGSDAVAVSPAGAQHPSVTADGSMLFYTILVETLWGRFWNTFYTRDGQEYKLTQNEIYDELEPVVSHDGTFAAFTTMRMGNLEIITLPMIPMAQNALQYQVTESEKPDEEPALANGDTWVYWTGRTGNHSYVFRQPGRGGAIQRVSAEGLAWDEHPSVSGDNRYVVYSSVNLEVPVAEDAEKLSSRGKYPWMGGGNDNRPDVEEEDDREPTPEEEIQTTEEPVAEGNSEIWILDQQTAERTRLTDNPAWDGNPTISADGMKIVFTSDRDGNYEIYIMNRDGSGLERLTNNEGIDDFAAIT
jgi:Tol biopolymer transport system component